MFEEEVIKKIKQIVDLKEVSLEIPPDPKLGDYAFPCFILSKTFKKNPAEIAKYLSTRIRPDDFIKEV